MFYYISSSTYILSKLLFLGNIFRILCNSASRLLLFVKGIIRISNSIILKRPIKRLPIICLQRPTVSQSLHQIRVTDKIPSIQKGIIFSTLDNTPGVNIIESASGKEWRISKDRTEQRQIDGR